MNEINWLSMLLATATPLTIGYLYYHPAVFGAAWKDSMGAISEDRTPVQKAVMIGVGLLVSFLLSFFLLVFNNEGINQEGDFDNFPHGAWHGFFIFVTVVTPIVVLSGLRSRMKAKHILIHLLYWLITLALIGGIVDAMNHWQNIPMPEGY